jgi:hypothetical protein
VRRPEHSCHHRAVDRYDFRPIRQDDIDDLLARLVAPELQNPAIIDDRDVEALPLSADINADLHSHASEHAPPQSRPHNGMVRERADLRVRCSVRFFTLRWCQRCRNLP